MSTPDLPFDVLGDRASSEPTFSVDIDGFEGPLDLLLTLARSQKVDLAKISILALAEQYLAFVDQARRMRLELAADYLVMAAWLAFLKSRLLLPTQVKGEVISAEELALALSRRLQRLAQIRAASALLMDRLRLGRDIFPRGAPEAILNIQSARFEASLYDLLSAYAEERVSHARAVVRVEKRTVWSLAEAREALERLVGESLDWAPLDSFLIHYIGNPKERKTALASSFASSLEMAREGLIELQQDKPYAPIYIRAARKRDQQT